MMTIDHNIFYRGTMYFFEVIGTFGDELNFGPCGLIYLFNFGGGWGRDGAGT
jgi:hypothetical protein